MEQKAYLTVAEYAQVKGISKQRVYQLLNKGLKPFVQEVEGRKVIDIRALSADELKGVVQGVQEDLNKFEQGVEQEDKPPISTETDILRQIVEDYKEQLRAKDRQIEAKDRQIDDLTRLLGQAQELNRNNQLLLAQKTQAEIEPEPVAEEVLTEVEVPPPPPKKKSFWGSLFGRG